MAFELIDSLNPTTTFGQLDTERPAFTFAPEPVGIDKIDIDSLNLDPNIYSSIYSAKPATNTLDANNQTNAILGDYLGGLKAKAQKEMFTGAVLKTVASSSQLFNSLLTWGTTRANINKQRENARLEAQNEIAAMDNQLLYVKNQLMEKFNQTVAQNTVTMAAKNLKVSSGALLEESKGLAHDIDMDMRTAESNAELKKIAARAKQEQADIMANMQKSNQFTQLLGGALNLGLTISTGGGTGESWGDLYAGYKEAQAYNEIY